VTFYGLYIDSFNVCVWVCLVVSGVVNPFYQQRALYIGLWRGQESSRDSIPIFLSREILCIYDASFLF